MERICIEYNFIRESNGALFRRYGGVFTGGFISIRGSGRGKR